MNKIQKNIMVMIGILMCIGAVTMVLELVNLSLYDFVFVIAGLSLLIYDRFTGSALARNIGLVALLPGCSYVLLKIFPALSVYSLAVYLVSLFILFVIFYILYRKNTFAVLSLLAFLAICGVMAMWFSADSYEMYGYVFMAISTVLLVVYFLKRKKIGLLPLLFAVFSYFCGLINFIASAKLINDKIYSVSVAATLLVAGLTVISYSIYKSKDKED